MRRAGWAVSALASPEVADDAQRRSAFSTDVLRRIVTEALPAAPKADDEDDVTVVVTHFERPDLLDQNLSALTRQTNRRFGVVVVDDGSRSPEASRYLAGVEERYRLLNLRLIQQKNQYVGAARNQGIRAANTEFVILLDDDNVPYGDMVGTLRRAIRRSEADIVTCGISLFHGEAEPRSEIGRTGPDRFFGGGPILLGAIHNCFGDASGIYRRSVFDKIGYFHELHGVTFEDWHLHLRAVAAGLRLVSVPEPLVWYRVRQDSMLHTTRRYDNARVIASAVGEMSCSTLEPLADYLMGSEAEQVKLNSLLVALQSMAAANSAALMEEKEQAAQHVANLEFVLRERTKTATDAEAYARSLETALAQSRESHRAASEYAGSLERSRAESEAYARALEAELRKCKRGM